MKTPCWAYLLVGFVCTIRVSDLGLKVVFLFRDKVLRTSKQADEHDGNHVIIIQYKTTYADTNEVSELGVSIDIHLHDAIGNSSRDLFFRGS